jgi:hypothetical protein
MSYDLTTGKYYLEFTVNDPSPVGNWSTGVGVGNTVESIGTSANSFGVFPDGEVYTNNATITTTTLTWSPGCVVGIAIGNGNLWYRVNNSNWNGSCTADPVAGTGGYTVPSAAKYFMAEASRPAQGPASITVNTAAPFVNAPPTGFLAWSNNAGPPGPPGPSRWWEHTSPY